MARLEEYEDFIKEKIELERWTHAKVSAVLMAQNPGEKGFSLRSVERFCSDKNIHKTSHLDDSDVDVMVADAVAKVGPTYGRKTITGLLASEGVRLSEKRVGQSLYRVNPGYHCARMTATDRNVNPHLYQADYFGHKLHVDQNEKCVMFGVTHVCAIDGYSGKIVGFVTMPVKNNVEIYTYMFRPLILQYGIWDQLRVDQGKEWVLMLYAQEKLADLRRNTDRPPHLQSTSKQNHCVERMWVEINCRVNYPIKKCLIDMQERGTINMDCEHTKFCVSWFSIRVSNIGTSLAVRAWNEHHIPNKGIPNILMSQNNQTISVFSSQIPQPEDLVSQFESAGGRITIFSPFGQDPLESDTVLYSQREVIFKQRYVDFNEFFYKLVNGDDSLFQEGLLHFIHISFHLESILIQLTILLNNNNVDYCQYLITSACYMRPLIIQVSASTMLIASHTIILLKKRCQ